MNQTSNNEQKQGQWHPNRNYIALNQGIIIDSCFPSGNIAYANIITTAPLAIEIEGNTDISNDTNSKGFRRDKPIKFILKNASHLRKYYGQTRYKPYMMYKEEEESWQANSTPIDISILQNGHHQGTFTFQSQKNSKVGRSNRSTNDLYPLKQQKILSSTTGKQQNKRGDCYLAIYNPYSFQDLTNFIEKTKLKCNEKNNPKIYFHQETITYSYERRKVQLLTITSSSNIESVSEKEPVISEEIFPFPKERPHKLKNNPVIMLTARVHPSETSSSFFIEGLVEYLLSDCKASSILRQLFIFQIIPMLNPDGVEHGNFRFDHQFRNLNRYYGQSSIDKTPSIRAAQLLISYYKNRNNQQCQFTQFYEQTYSRLFMYIDVHGHSSPMPSFIYGNHPDKIDHLIENKMFCKLIESNLVSGGFSKLESEFSKKNMSVQEKHDQFSKLCAGRVFAGRADTPEQSIFHSYTLEVMPYWEEFSRRKTENKPDKLTATDYAKLLGKELLVSLLDLLDLNPDSKLSELDIERIRRCIVKQCYNEQLRRIFLFKRAESSSERCSYSEIAKARQNTEKEYPYHNEYIQRWFHNQILLKNMMEKTSLLKEPKWIKFCQKISKLIPLSKELIESPRKDQTKEVRQAEVREVRQTGAQIKTEQKIQKSQLHSVKQLQDTPGSIRNSKYLTPGSNKKSLTQQERLIIINRSKQPKKIETKLISKHTIELNEEFQDLIPKKYNILDKDLNQKFPRREYSKRQAKKQTLEPTEKYQKEIVHKIHTQNGKNNMFEIKVKEIRPKPKSNIRLQTQNAAEVPRNSTGAQKQKQKQKIKSSNSQVGNFQFSSKSNHKDNENNTNAYHRPSFIEEFILKIREEREGLTNNSSSKYTQKEEIRHKILKYRPSLKDTIEQPQKSMLPVLRRNKIFTIASEPCPKDTLQCKGYDSLMQNKKRATTIESDGHIEDLVAKTKKILASNKKEEANRQSLKRSQKLTECVFL